MRTTLLWRCVSVWLFVVSVCWIGLYHHVGCKETRTQAGSGGPPPIQDLIQDQEPEERSTVQKVGESRVADTQSVTGYGHLQEETITHGHTEEQTEANEEITPEDQEAKEPSSDVRAQPETSSPKTVLPSGAALEDAPLETAVAKDQEDLDQQPPPSPTVLPAVLIEYDPKASPASAPSHGSISEPKASHVPESEQNVPDLFFPTDCDSADPNPYEDASPPILMENTSNAHPAGTKTRADPSPSAEPGPATRRLGANASHAMQAKGLSPAATAEPETDSAASIKDPEDIPTFDEWKRKMLEVEKEQIEATPTPTKGGAGGHVAKKVPKNFNNYASVECGAKILGANPEAKSTSDILKENMDLYMLNPCSNKIWFIIELCEPIQVTQLDIANFELFSSTPKDFVVSISNRYPTNKWLKLGTFHGRDERTVQSFPLDEHLYAKYVKIFTKYIKVELVSHFGSEHFCPLSLIRVFGTSMVEEYEENTDPHDRTDDQDADDQDYLPGYASGELMSSKDLIGSAKEVLNMMTDFAVNVLSGGNASAQEVISTELPEPQDSTNPDLTPSSLPGRDDAGPETSLEDDTPSPEETLSSDDSPSPDEPPSPADAPSPDGTSSPPEPTYPALPPMEEKEENEEEHIVIPLPRDEEEPIGPIIVLLEEEEDEEDEEERKQRETSVYCAFATSPSSSSSTSSRSCVASLQEHLLQRCSAALSKLRRRRTPRAPLPLFPPAPPPHHHHHHHIRSDPPAWELTVPASACPAPTPLPPPPPTPTPQIHVDPLPAPTPPVEGPREGEPGASEATERLEQDATGSGGSAEGSAVVLEPSRTSVPPATDTTASSRPTPSPPAPPAPPAGESPPQQEGGGRGAAQGLPAQEQQQQQEEEEAEPQDEPRAPSPREESGDPLPDSAAAVPLSPSADDGRRLRLPQPVEEQAPPPEEQGSPSLAPPPVDAEPKEEEFANDTPLPLSRGGGDGGGGGSDGGGSGDAGGGGDGGGVGGDGEQTHPRQQASGGHSPQTSSQKESVFMRLSNRIKSLEMNMSLSGRYLEQLSQRYRKQMEEMQRAFNKTVLKLQNTSRLAEEQEQRQTDSIQALGGQLENITHLVLNLAVRVSMLQREVSDRQSYLLICLLLCALLGTVVVANHFSASSAPPQSPALALRPPPPPPPRPLPPPPPPPPPPRLLLPPAQCPESSSSYCCSEREFTSVCTDVVPRRASYPLLHCDSFQLAAVKEPETVCTQDSTDNSTLQVTPQKRRRVGVQDGVPASAPWGLSVPGHPGVPLPTANGVLPSVRTLGPAFADTRSEGSSEGSSSHSDEPSFCGVAAGVCPRGLCPGLAPPPPPPPTASTSSTTSSSSTSGTSRTGKRGWRRRRSKPVCSVVDLLRAHHPPLPPPPLGTVVSVRHLPGSPLQDLARQGAERTHAPAPLALARGQRR